MTEIRKKFRDKAEMEKRLLRAVVLAAVLLLISGGAVNASAAEKVKFTRIAQKTSCIWVNWEQVNNASYYIITRTEAFKNGTLVQEEPKQWKTTKLALEDKSAGSGKSGRVFQYTITAMGKKGQKLAEGSAFIVKITSTFFNTCASDGGSKVLLKWGKIAAAEGYRIQWVPGTDFSSGAMKQKTVSKNVFSLTIPDLSGGQLYSFRIQAIGKGYHKNNGTDRIQSYSATSTKSVNIPKWEEFSIVFHRNDGSVIRTVKVAQGTRYSLPGIENPEGYTFMGWGRKKGMITSQKNPVSPDYEAYNQVYNLEGTVHLYAVLMKKSEEIDFTRSQLDTPDLSAYRQVVFVGDSRMARLERTLIRQKVYYNFKNISFVARSGAGLGWLESTGYNELLEVIESGGEKGKSGDSEFLEDSEDLLTEDVVSPSASDSRPAAVVFNMGINDLGGDPAEVSSRYIAFMNKIAPVLKSKNCRLFFMSVNPVNSQMVKKVSGSNREEWKIRSFNCKLRDGLAGTYDYINMYTWLVRTGYSTDAGASGQDIGVDDGLHYSVKTSKRIYLKCLQLLAG